MWAFAITYSGVAYAESFALQTADQACQEDDPTKKLSCIVITHDMLCYSSVIKGAILPGQNRGDCLMDVNNQEVKLIYEKAKSKLTGDKDKLAKLDGLYEQWRKNTLEMMPKELEPQYQFELRRKTNEQALIYKSIELQEESEPTIPN
jgi:hypothetical protein